MKVLFFGMYSPKYSRNHILIKGLKLNGVEVVECNDRSSFIWGFRYLKLLIKYISVKGWNSDIVFVGFPGQTDVPLAWILSKIFHQKLIFDAFISIYNTRVFDRKYIEENSVRAKGYWFIDWVSCYLADKVILDTNAHIDYFVRTFHLHKEKFIRIFVGTDPDLFYPKKMKKHKGFVVGFHGSYLPLQGVPVILDAAKTLGSYDDIRFQLLGDGIERKKCERIVKEHKIRNVSFIDKVPYEKLADFISSCDIYLGGPFGSNAKSKLVIPNKVYEAIACKKAVIVGRSVAMDELFSEEKNCAMVNQDSHDDLAAKILYLKGHKAIRDKLAMSGFRLFISKLTPILLTKSLV